MALKRKCFTVEEKMQIIRRLEAGERNVALAKEFCVCHTTIATIKKNKEQIRALFNSNVLKSKRVRASTQDQVDKALFQWFKMQRSRGISLNGPLLQQKANFFAKQFKIKDFNCSGSWISRFKVRHNILSGTASTESLPEKKCDAKEWLTQIWPALRKDYSDDDIFSANETGLLYKLTPDKTLNMKGEKCAGGELSKERITLLLAANMSGTLKRKLLVIGTSKRPRSFKNVQLLPVGYYSNRQAWMTSEIFTSWVRDWNAELKQREKKILLLIDDCPAHPIISYLTNITLVFLPPSTNTKSILQPMDQGVIRVIKSTYRKNLILKIISDMENSIDENYPKISILDAILMLNDAWQQLSPETIAKCFRQSGLAKTNLDVPRDDIEIEDDIPLSVWATALRIQLPISKEVLDEYVLIDNGLAICGEPSEDNIVKNILDDDQDSDDSVEDQSEDLTAPSVSEAFQAAEVLSRFVHSHCSDEILTHSMTRLNNVVRNYFYISKTAAKQSKITEYLVN
ncbi:PREDICTED: tigger transposable element-derived protein 4-like [Drosophila arizonae]|uniref:Tigger transposable element-derived protein 4-like n=1 Tax=Drosophila arizonae TaxID=7263 RepID=A0ABM1PVW2_DROAR|nr:PREDICTED: tigger transposable element-derived protein 4-like [Drosophila arizonae]